VTVERTPLCPLDTAAFVASGSAAHLRWLVRRIADNDRDAFGELFDRVASPMSNAVSRQVPDPVRVARIVAGAFVEVWWLAGGHVDPDTDVPAWITEIVNRRVEDSESPGPVPDFDAAKPGVLTGSRVQRVEVELAGLLARPPDPVECVVVRRPCDAGRGGAGRRPSGEGDTLTDASCTFPTCGASRRRAP
jgi:hypothetical protein